MARARVDTIGPTVAARRLAAHGALEGREIQRPSPAPPAPALGPAHLPGHERPIGSPLPGSANFAPTGPHPDLGKRDASAGDPLHGDSRYPLTFARCPRRRHHPAGSLLIGHRLCRPQNQDRPPVAPVFGFGPARVVSPSSMVWTNASRSTLDGDLRRHDTNLGERVSDPRCQAILADSAVIE
jgi:hypothetical protein